MSDTPASLRRKLRGAEQLGSVVRAMKAVAASSIGQYEKAVEALAQYQHTVELGLSLCLRAGQGAARAPGTAMEPDPGRPTGALVFGSDQGLVGRFNEIIADAAVETLRKLPGPKTVWAVGERLCPPLEEAGLAIKRRFTVPNSVAAIATLVAELQVELEEYAARERHAQIQVFHNAPRAAAHFEVSRQRLLPLDAAWYARITRIPWPNARSAEVLGGSTANLAALIHEHLFISLYRACAESLASENGSRLEAMQRAEKNIESVSDDLRRSLNRQRQSSIDEELFDVVAGFNALT